MEVCFCSGEIQRHRSANSDPHLPSGHAGVKPAADARNGLVKEDSAILGPGPMIIECLLSLVARQLWRVGKNFIEEREGAQFGLLMTTLWRIRAPYSHLPLRPIAD